MFNGVRAASVSSFDKFAESFFRVLKNNTLPVGVDVGIQCQFADIEPDGLFDFQNFMMF